MIVLDTQVWLWWLHDPRRLSPRLRTAIRQEAESGGVRVSAISVWEVATKAKSGKLDLGQDTRSWYQLAVREPGIAIEPVTPSDALRSVDLPPHFHSDPADRLIVALALRLSAPLATLDAKIRPYPHVRTIA